MGYISRCLPKWKRSIQKRLLPLFLYDNDIKEIFNIKSNEYHYSLSYAQHGQDLFVKNYYANKPHKAKYFFVDIGANDGIRLSNTYTLEYFNTHQFVGEFQNWGGGVMIEADSSMFKKLLENRTNPNIAKYNVALCDIDGEIEFMKITGGAQMLSGIVSQYDKRHLERIKEEIGSGSYEIVKMQGARFKTIMAKHKEITQIDYLSIDVEGGEMSILKSIDFDNIPINLMSVEDNYPDTSGIDEFLISKGYRKLCMLGGDSFFEKIIC